MQSNQSTYNNSVSIFQIQTTVVNFKAQETALLRRIDARAPILRLPVEIISHVFKLVQLDEDQEEDLEDWYWIIVTHVCRSWRNIAINSQALWTYIDTGEHASVEQTKAYLERSGTSKLIVYHDLAMNDVALDCLKLAVEQISRVSVLRIWGLVDIPIEVRSALQMPAPELQELVFHTYSSEVFDIKTLLDGNAPKLQDVSLRVNVPSWANVPILRNLKELTIGSESSPLTLQETYSILQENTSIKTLCISCQSTVTHPDDLYLLSSPIQLLALSVFDVLGASYEHMSMLLKNVVLPSNLSWNIHCKDYPVNDNPDADPRTIVPYIFRENEACETLNLTICTNHVDIRSTHSNSEIQRRDDSKIWRSLTYSWEEESGPPDLSIVGGFDIISSVIKDSFWCSAKILKVKFEVNSDWDLDYLLGYRAWRKMLKCLPELQELSVRHVKYLENPLNATVKRETFSNLLLSQVATHKDIDGKISFDCPKLSRLHLCDINLTTELNDLVRYLGFRSFQGYRLCKLELCEPIGLSEKRLAFLRALKIADEIEVVEAHNPEQCIECKSESEFDSDSDDSDSDSDSDDEELESDY